MVIPVLVIEYGPALDALLGHGHVYDDGTIVAGAPLLGLLGTVVGMIKIFSVVATAGSQVTEALSLGISEALVTTASGLIIAIPALFAHSFLEARAGGLLVPHSLALGDQVVDPPELEELGLRRPTLEEPWTGEEFMAALDAANPGRSQEDIVGTFRFEETGYGRLICQIRLNQLQSA